MNNLDSLKQQLKTELQRGAVPYGVPPAQHDAVVDASVPFFRLGNHAEALQKGTEAVLFPGLAPSKPAK